MGVSRRSDTGTVKTTGEPAEKAGSRPLSQNVSPPAKLRRPIYERRTTQAEPTAPAPDAPPADDLDSILQDVVPQESAPEPTPEPAKEPDPAGTGGQGRRGSARHGARP